MQVAVQSPEKQTFNPVTLTITIESHADLAATRAAFDVAFMESADDSAAERFARQVQILLEEIS